MTSNILPWVVIGSIIAIAYIPFFADIDAPIAGKPWGYPLVYLGIIFIWPIAVLFIMWKIISTQSAH